MPSRQRGVAEPTQPWTVRSRVAGTDLQDAGLGKKPAPR